MTFFTKVPLWVWPLLALLIVVGLNAMRTRRAPATLLYLLPLLGALSLRSVSALSPLVWLWVVFAGAYALGALAGARFQHPRILSKKGGRVHLRGEALTLITMLTLFSANFVTGALGAVAPQILTQTGFQAIFVGILAIASGTFLGRAISIARFSQT